MKNKSELLTPDPSCEVCNNVQRSAALSMFELSASAQEIASAINVSVESVEHHFTICIPAVSSPSPGDAGAVSDAQLQTLLRHALETYHACSLSGNAVGAASALSVRLRTLNELQRRAELTTEQQDILDGCDPLDPPSQWKSKSIREFHAAWLDGLILLAEK